MKGKRKKVQHFFVYIAMLVMSGFLIMGGLQQLSMTHELKSSIVQKKKEKKEKPRSHGRNQFNQFPQRDYSQKEVSSLEKQLLQGNRS